MQQEALNVAFCSLHNERTCKLGVEHLSGEREFTEETALVILVPPADPITIRTRPVLVRTTMEGAMEESGRFPGRIKLAGLGGTPNMLVMLGDEKSDISSFITMPVCSDTKPAPKLQMIRCK